MCTWTLTQPWATVIASVIALTAALIAYAGVVKSISSNRKESRRKEKLDILRDAANALTEGIRLLGGLANQTTPEARTAFINKHSQERWQAHVDAMSMSQMTLALYGYLDVLEPLEKISKFTSKQWASTKSDPSYTFDTDSCKADIEKALGNIHTAVSKLK